MTNRRTRDLFATAFRIAILLALSAWSLLSFGQTAPVAVHAPTALVINAGGHIGPVRRIAVDPTGTVVVSASDDKTAIVWGVGDMRSKHVLRVPVEFGEVGRLYGVAVAPAGDLVALAGTTADAAGRHRIDMFTLSTGVFVRSFDARGGDVKRLAWSLDGRFIAAVYARDPALRVFGVDGSLWYEQRLPGDAYGLSIDADGRLAVASFDRRVRLFRVVGPSNVVLDGEITTTLRDPVSVRHSPNGQQLAVGYFSRYDEYGDLGTLRKRVIVDVYNVSSRQLARSVAFNDVEQGNLMTVAWQADGRALYAGGTGYSRPHEHMVKRIAWPSGDVSAAVAASDSILDMSPLPDGRMLFSSFDGSVGILGNNLVVMRTEIRTPRVVDPADLQISGDARRLQWQGAGESINPRSFDVDRRDVGGALSQVAPAVGYDRASLMVLGVRNGITPSVNGHPVTLLPNETSRASALLPDRQSVILGASRALRRVGSDGRVQWALPLNTESRAVNVSADGRLVVAAMSDGTIRWHRASDGAPLLALLVLRDGRWVLWTESGHFDAGPGAEDLIGWLVTRPGGERADYHGVSRLRDRFLRPDIIDQVLVQQDLGRAIAAANAARVQLAQSMAQEGDVVDTVKAMQEPVVLQQALPAAIVLAKATPSEVTSTTLEVEVKVFTPVQAQEQILKARVDGRPVQVTLNRVQSLPSGETSFQLSIHLVKAAGKVQIAAEGRNGVSMPVEIDYRSSAPALRDRPRPSLFMVAVGISRYADARINLVQASKDARDIARSLEQQHGQFYERVQVKLLLDDAATRTAVLDALKWLQATPGPDDTSVLFLAGHGVLDAADTYYFLPHDMRESRLQRTAVSESQLREALSNVRGRALFFVDTCFAGQAIGKLERRETMRLINGMAQPEHGVIVFSGSARRQESLESSAWGNGAFTKALLDGLAGQADAAKLGFVTHVGLDGYVGQAVRALTNGRQTPVTAMPQGLIDYPIASVGVKAPSGATAAKEKAP